MIESVTGPVVEIRSGERMKTLIMFFYFFFTIALIYILKPVRNSLFLGELGARNLRWAYIGEVLFLILIVFAYTQLAKCVTKRILYASVLFFFAANLVLFWLLFHLRVPYLAAFYYVWVASFSITMTTQFWTLANDIFNPLEAKRLFGLIISGGSLGGILGGLLTHQAMRWIKTEDLLLVAAVLVILCVPLIGILWERIPEATTHQIAAKVQNESKDAPKMEHHSVLKLFSGSSYLVMLACLVIIAKVSATVVDNQFNGIVELHVLGKEARTAFFGAFMAGLNTLSFVMQFFVTSLCLRFLGVGFSLWILPLGLTVLTASSFLNPVLAIGLVLKLFDGSVNYSIQQASKETLYLPLASALRYRIKPVIDMLGFRLAKALGGFYIVVFAPLFGLSDQRLGILVLVLVPMWMAVVWWMKKGYSKLLRDHLLSQKQYRKAVATYKATDVLSFLHDEKDFEKIKSFVNASSAHARKLAASAYLAYARSEKDLESTRKIINRITRYDIFKEPERPFSGSDGRDPDAEFLASLLSAYGQPLVSSWDSLEAYAQTVPEEILAKVGDILRNPQGGFETRVQAVRILGYVAKQKTADVLLHALSGIKDHSFRFVILKTLGSIRRKNPSLKMNRYLIKNEILKEVAIHDEILKLHSYYRDHSGERPPEDYLDVALRAIRDENIERIFKCLRLLCPDEIVYDIYEQVTDMKTTESNRAQAIELLSQTLEHDLFHLVQPVLDAKGHVRLDPEEAVSVIHQFLHSEDRWFCLIGQFLIAEMQLTKQYPHLTDPLSKLEFAFWTPEGAMSD